MIDQFLEGSAFLINNYLGYVWLIVSVIFLLLEVGTPGLFFFLSFAIGCSFAAIAAFFELSIFIQCITAIVMSLVAFAFIRTYFSAAKLPQTKTNTDALIGQQAMVIDVIEPHKVGRVKIKGEEWPAVSHEDNVILQKGTLVKIIRVEGNRIIVK